MVPIQVNDLCVAYRGTTVLNMLTAEFRAKGMTAVTGPSGCGKSTLLYTLGLFARPTSGTVEFGSQRVDRLSDADKSQIRAHRIGFVFQDAVLDPRRTVLENAIEGALYSRLPRRVALVRGASLLESLGVVVDQGARPGQISGGQAGRVALARALATAPEFILADEPTGNLDAASARIVLSRLREEADRGCTVVIATHDPAVVAECDDRLDLGEK